MQARAFAIACILGAATPALADVSPEDAAAATALFEEGRKLIESKQIDPACEKFEASLKLDPQVGTKLNLADCRESQGRFVDAYVLFSDGADEAKRTGKEGRETFARGRLTTLTAKVARVTVRIAEPDLPGLSVKLGARALTSSQWATVQIVEPGPIVVEVEATGRLPARIERPAAAGAELVIEVPALAVSAPTGPRPEPPSTPRPSRLPFIVAGAGGALVITSVVVGLSASSKYDSAAERNDRDGVSRAQRQADIGTVIAVAGGLAVAVGVVLYVRTPRTGVAFTPTGDSQTVGVLATGSF